MPPASRQRPARGPLQLVIGFLSSMRLTVVLLLLLAALTFFGTLAQTQDGIFYVQKEYFESWIVLIPLAKTGLGFPLPGALPVLGLLFLNLMVGGVVRLRWHLRNIGVLIGHLGIALLLVAGFVKLVVSYAGHLSLYEGDTGNAVRSFQDWELALMHKDGDAVLERTLPGSFVERAVGNRRQRIAGDDLPFTIDVHHFMEHCVPMQKGPMFNATADLVNNVFLASDARFVQPVKDRDQKLAGCYVTVLGKDGGDARQGILWAGDLLRVGGPMRPFTFEMAGQTWGLELRHKLWTLPFDVQLDKFKKSDHPGSAMVRDYSSYVTVKEPDGADRTAHIYMNEPLRKDGYVFYQTSWGPQNSPNGPYYSTFEVASNPSDKWPEYACWVIAAGMALHFLQKLFRFIMAENRRRPLESNA